MQYYVYIYKDPSRDNEPIYVGKGSTYRISVHLRRKDKHPFTQRLQFMKKNGIKPIIEKINAGCNEMFAYDIEYCLIKRIGRKCINAGPLLNISEGGKHSPRGKGWHHTEESKQKSSKSNLGKFRSEETKKKCSDSRKKFYENGGKTWNQGTKKKKNITKQLSFKFKFKIGRPVGGIPWNKNKIGGLSPETIEKMSAAKRGKRPGNADLFLNKTWIINPNTGKREWVMGD